MPSAPAPSFQALDHLRALEAESIHILREVAAEFQRPVMLYSIGKDSSVMVRLAQKAFYPGKIPFPLLHIDTTYKFREMIEFRDRFCAEHRSAADRAHQYGGASTREPTLSPGHPEMLRTAEDPLSAGRPGGRRFRRGLRRGAARRGEIPRQRARLLLPRFLRPMGPQKPAAGAVESLQQPDRSGREHPGLSPFQLDRTGRVALHPRGEYPDCAAVLREDAADGGARRLADSGGAATFRCCPAKSRRW